MSRRSEAIHTLKGFYAMSIVFLLVACTPDVMEVDENSTSTHSEVEATPTDVESPEIPATPTWRAIPTLLPTPEGQLLINATFEDSTGSWEPRFGDFLPTTEDSYTGMGSGRLIASSMDARGDYTALVGQCVPLTVGGTRLEITVRINASPGGTYVNLSGVFTDDVRCRGAHVGTFSLPVDHGQGWIVLNEVIEVPEGANSLDFLISCAGDGPDTGILVDDVHLTPLDLP